MTLIGNSGFEYEKKIDHYYGKRNSHTYVDAVVRNTKTKEVLFTVRGSLTFKPYATYSTGSKKFLGFDDRYYYIEAKAKENKGTIDWGQIQSDGAVLRSDRTILTTLAFFPHYKEPVDAVSPKAPIIVKEPPNIPKVVVISPKPIKTPTKENVSWIQKIINWIIAILNR
jgi:hypothetical protein